MLSMLSFLLACETMDNPGKTFEQVTITETAAVASENNAEAEAEEAVDPMFQVREEVIVMGGPEEKEEPEELKEPEPIEEPPEPITEQVEPAIPAAQVAPAQPMRVSRVKDGWRPTLIASVMEGPTPRAILAMPSGEEKIVKAGDLLSEEGVVVMTIGSSFVELAVINSVEGRAKIENLTLTEQF